MSIDSTTTASLTEALDFSAHQVRALLERGGRQVPTYTVSGEWQYTDDPWAPSWAAGFMTGLAWSAADHTGDEWFADQARALCSDLEHRRLDTSTHDIGFLFDPSWGRLHEREGDEHSSRVLVDAGRTMARRFQAHGGYLSTWVDPGSTFIDVMMNVGVIFRAARLSGDETLAQVALEHSLTSRRHLVRGDGSTVHEGWFDTGSGEFLRAATHQGWRPDSTWARGQAWAVYGFTTAWTETGDTDLLDAAVRTADHFVRSTPGGVPPNDWLEPQPSVPYESSAAAIAAAGLLRLAAAHPEADARERFADAGRAVLDRLLTPEFLAVDTPGWQGVLRHATYHQRNCLGIDESVMWGDYYLVEAVELAQQVQP